MFANKLKYHSKYYLNYVLNKLFTKLNLNKSKIIIENKKCNHLNYPTLSTAFNINSNLSAYSILHSNKNTTTNKSNTFASIVAALSIGTFINYYLFDSKSFIANCQTKKPIDRNELERCKFIWQFETRRFQFI